MWIEPLNNRVVVKKLKPNNPYNFTIPDDPNEIRAEVVESSTCLISKGDIVLIGKYSGTQIKLNKEEYFIVREKDLLGILHSE